MSNNNTYLGSDNFKNQVMSCDNLLHSFEVGVTDNKQKLVNLKFADNNKTSGFVSVCINRKTAKLLVEKLNKEFELDEMYKSMYKKHCDSMEFGRSLNAEIKLIDKIIDIEGLEYWGNLLNIRVFYNILHKYENRDSKTFTTLNRDACVDALLHFGSAFNHYWYEKMNTVKDRFVYFLLTQHSLSNECMNDTQIDMCLSTAEELIKIENYNTWDKLIENLDNLRKKYNSYSNNFIDADRKEKILFALKYLSKYRTRVNIENEIINSIKPSDNEYYT